MKKTRLRVVEVPAFMRPALDVLRFYRVVVQVVLPSGQDDVWKRMRCYAKSSYAMLCQVKLCDVMPSQAMRCYAKPSYVIICQAKICNVMPSQAMLCYAKRSDAIRKHYAM